MGFEDILIVPNEKNKISLAAEARKKLQTVKENSVFRIDDFLSLIDGGNFETTGFLHEFLESSELHFLQTPCAPRNPELAARVKKLEAEQANEAYRKMTKTLVPEKKSALNLREDIKGVTSQVTAVINFVLSIGGSFFFAYKAVEYALPEQNIPAQVMMGILTSTIVALADLYFLARTI